MAKVIMVQGTMSNLPDFAECLKEWALRWRLLSHRIWL